MNSFRKMVIAKEDWNDEEYPVDICTEEAEVMENEANEIAQDVQAETADAERALDVADSLEDMAVVTDDITEATPAETQLVQIAGDMAAAGDADTGGDEIVPATEAYIGKRIAAEGFREKAREIWANIKAWLKKIWTKIEKFFYKIFGSIPRLRKQIKAMDSRVDKLDEEGASLKDDGKTFNLTSGIGGLIVDSSPIKKGSELKTALGNTTEAIVRVTNGTNISTLGNDIADKLRDFKAATSEEALESLKSLNTKVLSSQGKVCKLFGSPESSSKWPKFKVVASKGILGGKDLVYRVREDASTNANPIEYSEYLRSCRIEFASLSNKDVKLPDEVKFTTLTISEMRELLKDASKTLDALESFNRGSGKKEVLKAKDAIATASDKLEKSTANNESSNEGERNILACVRAAYKYNMMYTTIASTATTQAYQVGLQAVRTVLMLAARSCSQYKVEK